MKYQYKLLFLLTLMLACVILVLGSIYFTYRFVMPQTYNAIHFTDSVYKGSGVRVAFIANQGISTSSRAVLTLIKNEQTDLVIHLGNLDYTDNPTSWITEINTYLGTSLPYLAVMGNHDVIEWSGYQKDLISRLATNTDINCEGSLGVESSCTFKDIRFIFTTPGLTTKNHAQYIKDELALSTSTWNICAWHDTGPTIRINGQKSATSTDIYDACRNGGAIIAAAHEHSYSRTYVMSSFKDMQIASTSLELHIQKGATFAMYSGLGGDGLLPDTFNGNWWIATSSAQQLAIPGALFCTFGTDENTQKAECYFKDITGKITDQFVIVNDTKNNL